MTRDTKEMATFLVALPLAWLVCQWWPEAETRPRTMGEPADGA